MSRFLKPVYLVLLAGLLTFAISCSEEDKKKRSATDVDLPEMEPPVTANAPENLISLALLADESPTICDSDDCPTVAETIESRLFASEGSSITKLLDTADARVVEIEERSSNVHVGCFEEDATEVTTSFSDDHSVTSSFNCYDLLDDSTDSATGGQLAFGRSQTNAVDAETAIYDYHVVDRLYTSADNVRTTWSYQDDDENVEVWNGNANGDSSTYMLAHLKSTSEGVIEFARAAATDDDNGEDFVCGARVKLNADYIYVTGKIAAPSTSDSGCSGVDSVEYCLETGSFAEEELAKCEDAELTTFTIDAISPDDIDTDSFAGTINVDYAETVSEFSTQPLEE